MPEASLDCPVITVSELNRQIRTWLEKQPTSCWIEGEVSNLSKPTSGHYYFTLKDTNAQLRCVFFRNRHHEKTHMLQNGQKVMLKGQLTLYEARGDYQMVVEHLQETGLGELYRQFELLKNKLAALGLFNAQRKKPLPAYPKMIGVITSPHAAAWHDIQITLQRRYPLAQVRLYASDVQGKLAHLQLIQAIETANQDACCDVLILARGGGSLEDLWAFNHEMLADAMVRSQLPIISGVGHETDVTIVDFIADYRAATPTAAAEAATPDMQELKLLIQNHQTRLTQAIQQVLKQKQWLLRHQQQQLNAPERLISMYWQRLDYLRRDLYRLIAQQMTQKQHHVTQWQTKLHAYNPLLTVQNMRQKIMQLDKLLQQAMQHFLHQAQQRLRLSLTTLNTVSPLATLDRGYAIARFQNHVVQHHQQVQAGDFIEIRLAKGKLHCEVLSTCSTN